MHPSRRRKKRPNYGIRTVEVMRGPNGFGFTISGQQPCILSCIVANSPADQAGLRAGDFLISVNGVSVSKIAHDAVVNLIGSSVGPIRMTIAENYYSDSSDEDVPMGRTVNLRKPKYPHKPRPPRAHKQDAHRKPKNEPDVAAPMEEEAGPIEYKAIVGYLGTIEMPKQLPPNARLRTVCGCIKKLRQEKRKPTAVLMTVLPTCLTLKNAANHILAIYPTNRVVYISSSTDKESRYFGLVTSAVCNGSLERKGDGAAADVEISNSCHVFVADPKIVEHGAHAKKAESFRVTCTNDVVTGYCLEFPRNALYIVSLVQNMYRLQGTVEPHHRLAVDELVANSPQPSASSNSDSGIGFRDDCGNISDRIVVVEFPADRCPTMPPSGGCISVRPVNVVASNITDRDLNNVRATVPNLNNIRACIRNVIELPPAKQQNEERAIDVPPNYDSADNVSMRSLRSYEFKVPSSEMRGKRHKRMASCDDLAAGDGYETSLMHYKLSPKVYGVAKPTHSCEELSGGRTETTTERCGGSLRDLASWGGGCVERRRAIAQSEPDVRICEDNGADAGSGEGPAAWATSFEKLLECPVGLQTFAEFLKKEFSAENIYFWTACERFRKLGPGPERTNEAQRIYQQHLRVGASEAVNVDSQARQCVEQGLKNVNATLFVAAQKQIFNLMKFDSYSRFLKSELYKRCAAGENVEQQRRPPDPNLLLHPTSQSKLKKSLSNAEDRRRKSLLPWHRKNRSKSKDRGETEYGGKACCDVNENISEASLQNSDVHSSRSSLTSLDLAVNANNDPVHDPMLHPSRHPLCRVKLINGSMVVQIKETETVQQLIKRLLDKRGIQYSSFDVFTDKHPKALNLNESSTRLAGCEVEVQQRVTFRLDLPNKKVIAVKSKSTKVLVDVLRPILNKYSYRLEDVRITYDGEPIDVDLPVTSVDTVRLNVQLVVQPQTVAVPEPQPKAAAIVKSTTTTLDEITNRVYEDILQEKSDTSALKSRSDRGSVKSEDWGSEHSSSLIGRFLKRDSERNRERKKKPAGRSKGNSVNGSVEDMTSDAATAACKKPLIAKLKAGVKIQNTSESEELYEGLSRAQRSRLEDQRGTEINFELPDFLKDKENEQSRKLKLDAGKFYADGGPSPKAPAKSLRLEIHSNYENRDLVASDVPNGAVVFPTSSVVDDGQRSPKTEPPPLPPKPKILPIKPSNWKQRDTARKGMFLEQPSSSFV